MKTLCQRDPRWAHVKIGNSNLTVGEDGCTITAICDLLGYFGISITPDALARNPKNFTPEGLVDWQHLQIPGGFYFVKRIGDRQHAVRNDREIMASLKDPNTFVILEVNNHKHWVGALGKTLLRNDYRIDDPWYGDRSTACGRYGNITGSAHFARHPRA